MLVGDVDVTSKSNEYMTMCSKCGIEDLANERCVYGKVMNKVGCTTLQRRSHEVSLRSCVVVVVYIICISC